MPPSLFLPHAVTACWNQIRYSLIWMIYSIYFNYELILFIWIAHLIRNTTVALRRLAPLVRCISSKLWFEESR